MLLPLLDQPVLVNISTWWFYRSVTKKVERGETRLILTRKWPEIPDLNLKSLETTISALKLLVLTLNASNLEFQPPESDIIKNQPVFGRRFPTRRCRLVRHDQ